MIAEEIINHIKEKQTTKLVILLQSKEAIIRLLDRVTDKLQGITTANLLVNTGKILKLISDDLKAD